MINAKGTNEEPGVLRFDVIQDGVNPNRIYIYELYRDPVVLAAHRKMPHYQFWQKWRDKYRPSGTQRRRYT